MQVLKVVLTGCFVCGMVWCHWDAVGAEVLLLVGHFCDLVELGGFLLGWLMDWNSIVCFARGCVALRLVEGGGNVVHVYLTIAGLFQKHAGKYSVCYAASGHYANVAALTQ